MPGPNVFDRSASHNAISEQAAVHKFEKNT